MEILLIILISIIMLMVVCIIGRLVFDKDLKNFHIHVGLKNGFDVSGSFFDRNYK